MAVKGSTSKEEASTVKARPRWYIVQTYVGFEDAVNRALELKIRNVPGLASKILEIFIPTKKVIKLNRKGERQEKPEKVYPGYIYLHMLLDKEVGYMIQNTQYVSRIAGTGDFAVALEDGYVERLKEQLFKDSEDLQTSSKVSYSVGELVKVVDGPFKDMQGKVSGLDPQNSRIIVLLTIFDRETSVELDVLEVRKL
ncbi:MAG: transcription termination/antitermination NusG family protein [Patescibacteria group bacterium]